MRKFLISATLLVASLTVTADESDYLMGVIETADNMDDVNMINLYEGENSYMISENSFLIYKEDC